MNTELNIELLAEKQVRGELNGSERARLEAWLAADPLNRKAFEELCEIISLAEAGMDLVDPQTDAQWAGLRGRIAEGRPAPTRRKRMAPRVWVAAAAVVLLAAVGFFVLRGEFGQGRGDGTEVYTAQNQEKTVNLPDGSEVVLQPGARLALAADFGEDERRMQLRGKALFRVTRDEAHPFVVQAGNTETKVLGTVFALEAGASGTGVDLHVVSGKVRFSGLESAQAEILTANMKGHYDKETGEISVVNADGRTVLAGNTPTRVIAKDQPIREVLPRIESVFGVSLEIPADLLDTRLTGTFEAGKEADMLAALELILDGKFEKKGANYSFLPRH